MESRNFKQLENSNVAKLASAKRWKIRHHNIRKKQKIPKRTVKQITAAKTKCGLLYRISYGKSIILDDESYFILSHSAINGNDNFYSSDVSQIPESVKYRPIVKFEKKLLVYICMSDKGISTPVFRESGYVVNKEIYLNEKKVVSFIGKHHSCGDYVFWPDLAS